MTLRKIASFLALIGALAACDREFILEGERFPLRAAFSEGADTEVNRAEPINLPAQVNHSAWTHRLGTPNQRLTHPALGQNLQRVWSVNIGQGDGRRHRITADPVAEGGRIFTLDSRATVSATSTSGQILWTRDLTPAGSRADDASGGGLTLSGGLLYVTSSFGVLTVMDPATGAVRWTKRFDAPLKSPATISGDHIYLVASDSSAWALDLADGRTDWQLPGTPSPSSMVGGAAPAVSGDSVYFPTPAGELIAASRATGQTLWRTAVAGTRMGAASAWVTDVTGDPVIEGDRIFVGNQSGRVMAIDRRGGSRLWTSNEAAYGAVWPVGGSIFLMSDRNRLIRLDASSGARIWSQDLPLYTSDRERRRAEIFAHYGPVLAGGRLIVASNDGLLRSFNPASGELLAQVDLPSGAASSPIVVDGTLYVVTGNGQLNAYR